jgi:hypothetical protein
MSPGLARKLIIACSGLALLTVGAVAIFWLTPPRIRLPRGPEHMFELSERPKFLTEELALSYAREALKAEGLNPADWQPVPNGRTHAPDGRVDAYMTRTEGTPYRGLLLFTRAGRSPKFVAVELQGKRIVCQNSPGR